MTIDPVSEGHAYREMLFGLVGSQDALDIAEGTGTRLRGLVADASDALRTRPEPSEWSVLEVVAHIVDAELVCATRYRWTIAHDEPELIGYDQDRWVDRLGANEADPHDLLEMFDVLRRANVRLFRTATSEDKRRVAHHTERGPESVADLFRLMAGHDLFHIEQAQRTLERVRNATNV